MNVERVFRILWGPTLENTLDFAYPVVGASPTFWRAPRPDSNLVTSGAVSVALITGRYYRMKVTAKYFAPAQNFGGTGLQAFIDWAADSNAFTLMPNIAVPALTVSGCYLEGPFDALAPSLEGDSTQTLDLTILHPTQDLGLAWRGLWFEYVAGQSLTDPTAYTFTRSSVGYEITPQGYLLSHPSDNICDGHYPDRVGGVQTLLLEPAVTNDITNPEDLTNASWSKNLGSIPGGANTVKAPDGNVTAETYVEDTSVTAVHALSSNAITITAGDKQTAVAFVRPAGRFIAIVWINDSVGGAGGNRFGVQLNMHTGVYSSVVLGTASLDAFLVTPLANGWFMVWFRGAIGGAITSTFLSVRLGDVNGLFTYTGDGVSGMSVWGATAVHGVNNFVASYTPTTAAKDNLFTATMPAGFLPTTPRWIYVAVVEAGARYAPSGQFPTIITVGTQGAYPNWRNLIEFAGAGSINFTNDTSSGSNGVSIGGGPSAAVGQLAEYLGLVFPDGSIKLLWSIGSGAEGSSAQSSVPTGPVAAVWAGGATVNFANAGGGYGSDVWQIVKAKIGAFVATGPSAVATVAAARAA